MYLQIAEKKEGIAKYETKMSNDCSKCNTKIHSHMDKAVEKIKRPISIEKKKRSIIKTRNRIHTQKMVKVVLKIK